MTLREHSPFFTGPDDVMLAGQVLHAFETGYLMMHAADYMELSAWMTDTVHHTSTPALLRLRIEGPAALRAIAENSLYIRGEHDWASDLAAARHAESVWRALLARLNAGASVSRDADTPETLASSAALLDDLPV